MALPDDQFETMLARTRAFRRRIAELGGITGSSIDQYIEGRLSRRRGLAELPPPQHKLAEEIIALLEDRELSPMQGAQLERTFFGRE